jgi:pimeloyl-ACP methyl ester carboxylesterase
VAGALIPLVHGRVRLALHALRVAPGPALLLLHGLRSDGAEWNAAELPWPGAVYALDFSGHGGSAPVRGGGYTPELLAGDADAALAHLGSAALVGRGLGAYVALLLAGGRPGDVPGALLLPGPGLAGGGAEPDFEAPRVPSLAPARGRDAFGALERDVRPEAYAESFARSARRLLLAEDGGPLPPWWSAARRSPSAAVVPAGLTAAVAALGRSLGEPGRDSQRRRG